MAISQLYIGFLWTLAAVAAKKSHQGNIVLKSFQRATMECKQYLPPLNVSDALCLSRCEALVLRSWNDCSGLQYIPYSRHFKPCPSDHDYLNRTLACLDENLKNVPSDADCSQASIYWRCYRDQWGNLIGTPQLAPLTDMQVMTTIDQCAQILQIEPQEMANFPRNNFDVSDRSRCLMRCFLIRQGLYNDADGPDLDKMYVQCGGYSVDENTFKHNAKVCIEKLRSECPDSCTLATRIVKDCFPMDAGIAETLAKLAFILSALAEFMEKHAHGPLAGTVSAVSLVTVYVESGATALQNVLIGLGFNEVDVSSLISTLKAHQAGSSALANIIKQ